VSISSNVARGSSRIAARSIGIHPWKYVLAIAAIACGVAQTDEFHYNNAILGARAMGLAGAYTAVADDASGLAYNPAGIVLSQGDSMTGSVNAYQRTQFHYDKVGEGDTDWNRDSSNFVPNFFGIIKHFSLGTVGISYAITDSLSEDQDHLRYSLPANDPGDHVARVAANYNNEETTYNVGPSYARMLSPDLSFGVTLYLHYRKAQTIDNENTLYVDDEGSVWTDWYNDYWELHEYGVRPILGLLYAPKDGRFSLGLTLRRTVVLWSNSEQQTTEASFSEDDSEEDFEFYKTDARKRYPWTATLGAAFFPTHRLLLSTDLTYHTAVTDHEYNDRRAVLDGAVGIEYYLTNTLAIRGGLFTNRANSYDPRSSRPDQDEQVDLYGSTLSLSYERRGRSISLGGSYSRGTGTTRVGQWKGLGIINDMSASALTIFAGAAYQY